MLTSKKNIRQNNTKPLLAILVTVLLFLVCLISLLGYTHFKNTASVEVLSKAERDLSLAVYNTSYSNYTFAGAQELSAITTLPHSHLQNISPLVSSDIFAHSAIIIDAKTGSILFEKNADDVIPPASLTKLVAIYTVFKELESNSFSLEDVVPLPQESWAKNIPPGSSLMFLQEGQRVTLRELISGMAVVSGNDAAIAVAYHIAGSVSAFVALMNEHVQRLGLEKTFFVEPSGLSEDNKTTAREFANFCKVYVSEFPEALHSFHSLTHLSKPIFQRSTNKLLGELEGLDGLKTGFIYKSGFNVSLTAQRKGIRFISVTLGGPGKTTTEGNFYRKKDGTRLLEWAFANYTTIELQAIDQKILRVWKGSKSAIHAIPAKNNILTIPKPWNGNFAMDSMSYKIITPMHIDAPIYAGDEVGTIEYFYKNERITTIPLLSDRTVEKSNIGFRILDSIAKEISKYLYKRSYNN